MILADEARAYFAHPSQQRHDMDPASLHDNGVEYRADSGVCLAFHASFWPTVWMVHIGVMPNAWGKTVEPCKQMLTSFMAEKQAERIIAWIPSGNRAALSLARRVGFEFDGALPLPGEHIIMIGWRA